MKRHIFAGCFTLCLVGCFEEEAAPMHARPDAGADAETVAGPDAGADVPTHDSGADAPPPPVAAWPRSHPIGTLLVDNERELWMVAEGGIRLSVSGDDTLGEIGMDEHDAIPMTAEEERCLFPSSDYWGPGNFAWQPVYGPHEDDPGPFILDWDRRIRRSVSFEALESWGYYWRWMDYFDGGEDEWQSFTYEGEPVGLRDGTLVHTEYGFYYVVHGRSFFFHPASVAAEAGYHLEDSLSMSDRRLRELAPASTAFTRETFDRCPADEAL